MNVVHLNTGNQALDMALQGQDFEYSGCREAWIRQFSPIYVLILTAAVGVALATGLCRFTRSTDLNFGLGKANPTFIEMPRGTA